MPPRYLIFVGPRDQVAALEARAERIAGAHGLVPVAGTGSIPGLAAFTPAGGAGPCGDNGLVLGATFARGGVSGPDRYKSAHSLARDHWGSYVAILPNRREHSLSLVRSAFGELGCYYWTDGALVVAASDVELLCAWAGAIPPIDWSEVARHLIASELRTSATCLKGIRELVGGTCLTVQLHGCAVETLWSPWNFVAPLRDPDLDALAAELRSVVGDCVGRMGHRFKRVLLGLSGGLDSSVVAASLASAGVPFDCLTLVTSDALGDERPFAGAVARALGLRLIEAPRRLAGVDVTRSNAAHLPRPVGRSFAQESERNLIAAARDTGAEAIFRGGGGDNVFCYLQSVRPIVDRVRTQGWLAALESLGDVSRLTGCGLPTALYRTVRHLRRPPAYRFATDTSLLSPEAAAGAGAAARHPWLDAPPSALPGQAAHIALILGMSNHMEPLAPEVGLPLLSPLMAQPIVEFCLRVPTWLWCRGGTNRTLARRAFADALPPAIIGRRGKGAPDSFVIEIFEANRSVFGEFLEDGLLASQGLIDLAGVRAVLADTAPVRGNAYARVMQLADAEAWARSWTRRTPPG